MPASFIQLPADGSGKKADTFQRTKGANTVDTEGVYLDENVLASYTVAAGATMATANSHLLQIMAGASLKVRIRRIELYQTTVATTAALISFGVFRLSTAGTGGGAVTPAVLDTADAASGATAMTLPTVKGTEGAQVTTEIIYVLQTAGASVSFPMPLMVVDFDRPRSKPLIIAAGTTNGIAIKCQTGSAAATANITVWFDESNF